MWRPRYGTISNAQASPGSVPDRTSRAPVAPQTAAKYSSKPMDSRMSAGQIRRHCEIGLSTDSLVLVRKAVADASYRLEKAIVSGDLERFAQAPNVDVHGAFFNVYLISPHLIEQLGAAEGPVGMGHEKVKEPILRRGNVDACPICTDPATEVVDT